MTYVEKYLMNKTNGLVAPAIRVQFYDKTNENIELEKMQGYSMVLRDSEFDGWLIYSGKSETTPEGSGPWLFVEKKYIDEACVEVG